MWFHLCWLLLENTEMVQAKQGTVQVDTDNEGKKIEQVQGTILDKVNLTGYQDWDPEDQEEADP